MTSRRNKGPSRLATALFFFGVLTVGSIITVLFFATPVPPRNLAVLTVIVMTAYAIWLPVSLGREHIMEKRRRERARG